MIDLAALFRAFQGDPAKKVTVNKKWLEAVYNDLRELERRRAEEQEVKDLENRFKHMDNGMADVERGFEKVFGRKGMGRFFGRDF